MHALECTCIHVDGFDGIQYVSRLSLRLAAHLFTHKGDDLEADL